ncbi:hypothetical protein LCGC14_2559270, partial [marine sediment metagenome]
LQQLRDLLEKLKKEVTKQEERISNV